MAESKVKPGWKTTEFWISVAGTVALLVMTILSATLPEGHQAVQIAGAILSGLVALGYSAGRAVVKATDLKAEAVKVAGSALPVEPEKK